MMPVGLHNRIKSYRIYYYGGCIRGFYFGISFFDKGRTLQTLSWKIGDTTYSPWEEVELEENEVIIGVVAKLYGQC